ncbi:MAG: outer membrane protein assembly factor BamA [Bdellovibrionaceae bacterium]|nr:outer membrane protein assembly factor BamA [Pseudobdellovibrionaceae bacterium]
MRAPRLVAAVLIYFFVGSAWAQSAIGTIKVDGNKKIESSAILEKISLKPGMNIDKKQVREDIQNIFDMGFFENVQVEKQGNDLIYKVVEKPTISAIEYKGNGELDESDLKDKIGIKPFEIVNYGKIQKAMTEIQHAYEEKGYLLVNVTFELQPDPKSPQSARLVFTIDEKDKVRVQRVAFIGNKEIKSDELKAFMMTQEGGLFSFLSGGGTFKQEIFDEDVRRIGIYYLNKGYVQAQVSRPEVSVTPDKKGIYIAVRIDEGEKFQVGEVDFAGELEFDKAELRELIQVDKSVDFSYETMQGDLRALEAKYGDLGYAYANIIPRTAVLQNERKVNITYEVEKGQKVYFRKINITGNSSTRDKVVRRELRIYEGELYNETQKRVSLANIKRLGYFEDVQFLTKTPPGREDLMDIDIVVKERNTGQFQLGAGYATALGPQLTVQLNETNFLGLGYRTGLSVQYNGKNYQNYNLNFTDPYFNDTFWTVGTDLYYSDSSIVQFVQKNIGGTLHGGHPLFMDYFQNNNFYAYLSYKYDDTFVSFPAQRDLSDVLDPRTVNGITSSTTFTLEYDKRNDRLMPTAGSYASTSFEYAGIGGDIKYMRSTANVRYYKNIFWDVVFRNNLSYGIISAAGGDKVPFTQLFRLGGPNNLRGYSFRQVGTRAFSDQYYKYLTCDGQPSTCKPISDASAKQLANTVVGGTQQAYYMAELEFPLAKEAGMRAVMFYDVGIAEDDLVASRLRSDVGFGIRWFSPMGPLRFEFGFPLKRQSEFGERSNNFQFAVGSPF